MGGNVTLPRNNHQFWVKLRQRIVHTEKTDIFNADNLKDTNLKVFFFQVTYCLVYIGFKNLKLVNEDTSLELIKGRG